MADVESGLADAFAKLGKKFRKTAGATVEDRKLAEGGKIDGRTLRKTGRTELFSARVTKETNEVIRAYAKEHGLLLGELLEGFVEVCRGRGLKDAVARLQNKRG